MALSKQEVIERLRLGWRASGNYENQADFDLVGPNWGGATPPIRVSVAIIRQLVQDGVLRRPRAGLGKAFMESAEAISR